MRSFLRRLGFAATIGAAGGVLICLSGLVTFITGSMTLGGLTAILLGTGLVIWGLIKGEELREPGLEADGVVLGLAAAITAALAGFVGGVPLVEIRRLSFAEQREVSTEELVNHPEVALFRLRDGHVAARDVHTESHLHSDGQSTNVYSHAVAPVLPPTWRPGEPVRVWAVCNHFSEGYPERKECLEAWREPPGGAVAIDPELESCFRLAVPAGQAPSDGRIAFVHWVKSPEAWLEARWDDFLGFIRGCAIGWGLFAAPWLLWSTWRNRAGRAS